MAKTLIVSSRVKELCKTPEGKQLNVSANLTAELTKVVENLLARACDRSVQNSRTTVMAKDL